jgi:hypothetical protein
MRMEPEEIARMPIPSTRYCVLGDGVEVVEEFII